MTCNLGTLANGASTPIDIVVTPTVAGTLTNSASVTASETDPNSANNSASEGTTVILSGSPTGPVAQYKLDDGSGLIATDASGNSNNGTLVNGPTWTTGKVNGALDFDGIDDYVDAGSDTSIDNIFDNGGTIAAWVYPRTSTNWLIRIADKSGLNWEIDLTNENGGQRFVSLCRSFSIGEGCWKTTNRVVSNNVWTHIAVVYDNSNIGNDPVFYVNGVNVATTELIAPSGTRISDSSANLRIGVLNGVIDEVRIYNRALSSAEVLALFNSA